MKAYGGVDVQPYVFLTSAQVGQFHAPAALLPGKEPSVPIGYEAVWAPVPVGTTWRNGKVFALPELELRPRSQSISRLLFKKVYRF
jgi:hypothetical protein